MKTEEMTRVEDNNNVQSDKEPLSLEVKKVNLRIRSRVKGGEKCRTC
jgi:hypothetical protein